MSRCEHGREIWCPECAALPTVVDPVSGSGGRERLLEEMTSAERKASPVFSGVMNYFPDALAAVAALSKYGNDKHNPGEPLHWAREKSTDHTDCIARHLIGAGTVDPESGFLHDVGLAWRALANLQLKIEAARKGKG